MLNSVWFQLLLQHLVSLPPKRGRLTYFSLLKLSHSNASLRWSEMASESLRNLLLLSFQQFLCFCVLSSPFWSLTFSCNQLWLRFHLLFRLEVFFPVELIVLFFSFQCVLSWACSQTLNLFDFLIGSTFDSQTSHLLRSNCVVQISSSHHIDFFFSCRVSHRNKGPRCIGLITFSGILMIFLRYSVISAVAYGLLLLIRFFNVDRSCTHR